MKRGPERLMCSYKGHDLILDRVVGQIKDWNIKQWVSNKSFNDVFSNLDNFDLKFKSLIEKQEISVVKVKAMLSNDNIVVFSHVFKTTDELFVIFYRKKESRYLITLPSKTVDEILATGLSKDGKYEFPLLMKKIDDNWIPINLF